MPQPTLFRVSLKYHSPEEIYDYFNKNFSSKLAIKVKVKQAILFFQQKNVYDALNETKAFTILGKRIQLVPITQEQEVSIVEEPEQQKFVEQCESGGTSKKPGFFSPDFNPQNQLQATINKSKHQMMEFLHCKFNELMDAVVSKNTEITNKIKEKDPRARQKNILDLAIQKKIANIRKKYEKQLADLKTSIEKFVVNKEIQMIDVEPRFAIQEQSHCPKITLQNIGLTLNKIFTNLEGYPCKRIFPLNKSQFLVTTSLNNQQKGKVNIYDVNRNHCTFSYQAQHGAYGLTIVDKLILVGTYKSSLMTIDFNQEEVKPEYTNLTGGGFQKPIIQLKKMCKKDDKYLVAALSNDKTLRIIEISEQQVMEDVKVTSIEENKTFSLWNEALGLEKHNERNLLIGMKNKVCKYEIEKGYQKQYDAGLNVLKIKKFNDNTYVLACENRVKLLDVRAESVVQTFPEVRPKQQPIRAVQFLPEHTIAYGASNQIGLLDDRLTKRICWTNDIHHQASIYDITQLGDQILSCDYQGKIISWKINAEPRQ